jgi:hypothetical protein
MPGLKLESIEEVEGPKLESSWRVWGVIILNHTEMVVND